MMRVTPSRPVGPAERRGRWSLVLSVWAVAAVLASVLFVGSSAGADQLLSGIVDNDEVDGPRWTSALYTPAATGEVTVTLTWSGDGDLAIDLRVASTNAWVADDASTDQPKAMVASLTGGVAYRVAVWARSGSGTYSVDVDTGTTTTTLPPGNQVLLDGTADSAGVAGPRWQNVSYTAPASGEYRFDLAWVGDGDLDVDVRLAADGTWIAADASADHPKSLATNLTEGAAYSVAVWASAGSGSFTLSVTPPQVEFDCWFTREGSVATIEWLDEGGFHVLRRNDAWLATPGVGVASWVDVAAPPNPTYVVRTWVGSTSLDRPCVDVTTSPPADGLVVQRGVVSATGDPRTTMGHTVTPSTGGPVTAELGWSGAANLDLEVTRVSDGQVVGSAATAANPEVVTFTAVADTDYRITTSAASGTAAFALSLSGHRSFPTPPSDAPNILIINVDDARPEALEVMPDVVSWFGDQGTSFSNATVSTPACCPSRAVLMTGQYVHNNGQRDQNTPSTDQGDTIQRHLADNGYLTGHTGKYLHYYDHTERAPHWDRWNYFKGGYHDVWVNRDGQVLQSDVYSTTMTFDRAVEYVEDFDSFDDDRPWYLHVTPVAPHRPSEPDDQYVDALVPAWVPSPSVGEADRSDKPPWVNWIDHSGAEAEAERAEMHRTMMSVDDRVDALMTRLAELGELDDTIAIFTSDNGYFWGEHRLREKFLPYFEAVHVPFLIRWPGHASAGGVDDRFVSHVDIFPTVLAAAGVSADHVVDGTNIFEPGFDRATILTEYWEDPANGNGVPDWTAIQTDTYMYAEYFDADDAIVFREYYDLVADPYELVNLFQDGDPGNDPDITGLSAEIQLYRTCAGGSCP